MIYRWYT